MEVSSQLHTPATLPPGKKPLVPKQFNRRLGEPQNQSTYSCEEINSQPLLGLKCLIIQPIAQHYTIELSQLPVSDSD
jgi:hypothetical protein